MSRAVGILRNFNFLFTKLTKPYFSLDVLTEISYDIFTGTYMKSTLMVKNPHTTLIYSIS